MESLFSKRIMVLFCSKDGNGKTKEQRMDILVVPESGIRMIDGRLFDDDAYFT
jgi:hypothetical protein